MNILQKGGAVVRADYLEVNEPDALPIRPDMFAKAGVAWTRETFDGSLMNLDMSVAVENEIRAALELMRERPLPIFLENAGRHKMPETRAFMTLIRAKMDRGAGVAVINGIDFQDAMLEETKALFWLVGGLFGRVVATKWDGTMVYDVRDIKRAFGYGVRGSTTNRKLAFHTDNAFGRLVPRYVGLYCVNQAEQGGQSRVCNLNAVLHELSLTAWPLVERLFQPMFYDRQAEHGIDQPKVMRVPMLRLGADGLIARLTPNLVRSGYQLLDVEMDETLCEALEHFEGLLEQERFSVQFTLQKNQIQFLNNYHIAHARDAFEDVPDTGEPRHMLRSWFRNTHECAYDG